MDSLTEPPSTPPRPSRIASFVLPPDFYPERKVEASTWAEAIFEPTTLIGAVVCFVLGIVQLGEAFSPGWPTRFVTPLAIAVGIEAFLYSRRLSRASVHLKEWLVLLAPVVLGIRLLPYLDDPTASLGADVGFWIGRPESFFTFAFLVDCALLLLVWTVVFVCVQFLNGLRVQPGEVVEETSHSRRQLYEDNYRAIDHSVPLRQLGQLFVWGGVILVIIAAMAAIGSEQTIDFGVIGQIVGFQRPARQLVQLNVVLYFVFGLLLLGEAHFIRQRTLWRLDRMTIPTEVPSRWVAAVGALVVVAVVIGFLLPTSYALTLGQVVTLVLTVLTQLSLLLVGGFLYLVFLIVSLFGFHGGSGNSPGPPSLPQVPPAAVATAGASPLDALKSLVFWLIILGILAYSFSVLWRKRAPWLSRLSLAPILGAPFRLLLAIIGLLRRAGREVARAVAAAIPRLFRPPPTPVVQTPRFISLRRLGPRGLVEYFYLSVCERAAKLGYPRLPGVTPVEYQQLLEAKLPLVDPEIAALTAAFLEARYGPRPTTDQTARSVRQGWELLKKKLRGARIQRLGRKDTNS